MKIYKLIKFGFVGLLSTFMFFGCTDDFEEINTNDRVLTELDAVQIRQTFTAFIVVRVAANLDLIVTNSLNFCCAVFLGVLSDTQSRMSCTVSIGARSSAWVALADIMNPSPNPSEVLRENSAARLSQVIRSPMCA